MTDQHVPVERLAAYAAGDLDATAALEVEAHVLLCADCRGDVEAVQRVAADLAAVPTVVMPDDVAARVDAALAAEAEAAADTGADTGAGPQTPPTLGIVPEGPVGDVLPMTRKRRPSFAGIAAVAAGVALVAGIGLPLLTRTGSPRTTADSGAQPEGGTVATRRLESGLDYDADAPHEALLRALSGTRDAAVEVYVSAPGTAADQGSAAPKSAGGTAAARMEAMSAALNPLQTNPARLAACVTALAEAQPEGVGRVPLLVDFGTFEQRPALIVVFPTVRDGQVRPDRVDFWAVGPSCGVTPGDDDVLYFERFGRPPGL